MGWPEFQKCCGCFSLTTGTIIIGCWTIISSAIALVVHSILLDSTLKQPPEQNESTEGSFPVGFILIGVGMLMNILMGALGVVIIIKRKDATSLRILVFYMMGMCVTGVLVVVVSISIESHYYNYFTVFVLIINAYSVLILRSNQLNLEGRLTNPIDVRRRTIENRSSLAHVNHPPPPPSYEESLRFGPVHRLNLDTTVTLGEGTSNDDRRNTSHEQTIGIGQNVPIRAQSEAASSNTEIVNRIKLKEPECVIYDERQLRMIREARVMNTSGASIREPPQVPELR